MHDVGEYGTDANNQREDSQLSVADGPLDEEMYTECTGEASRRVLEPHAAERGPRAT